MSSTFKYIGFRDLEDLVRLVINSPAPFLQHFEKDGKHAYFLYALGLGGSSMTYMVELEKPIGKKYVIYNRFQDSITFSDRIDTAAQTLSIPILEVKSTNIFENQEK